MWRERHNFYYVDSSIWPNKREAHPVAPSWTALTQVQISTNWPNKRAAHPVAPSWTAHAQIQISTNWPNKRAAHPVAPSWTALAQVQISTNWPNKREAHPVVPSWTAFAQVQISTGFAQSQISTNVFTKITKIPSPSHDVIHITAYFLSGVFIMTFAIVVSSAHEREHLQ